MDEESREEEGRRREEGKESEGETTRMAGGARNDQGKSIDDVHTHTDTEDYVRRAQCIQGE